MTQPAPPVDLLADWAALFERCDQMHDRAICTVCDSGDVAIAHVMVHNGPANGRYIALLCSECVGDDEMTSLHKIVSDMAATSRLNPLDGTPGPNGHVVRDPHFPGRVG